MLKLSMSVWQHAMMVHMEQIVRKIVQTNVSNLHVTSLVCTENVLTKNARADIPCQIVQNVSDVIISYCIELANAL